MSRPPVSVPSSSSAKLPPWGDMDEGLLREIRDYPIPPDWKPSDGSRVSWQKWARWRDRVIQEIADIVWPVYVPGASLWETAPVRSLFNADFALLARLHPVIQQPIRALNRTTVTHSDFFFEEDDVSQPFATGYERYDPQLAPRLRAELRDRLNAGIDDKVASLDLQMKQVFQRPRAYQVAVIQQRRHFSHLLAKSANTPSLVSGHCLESTIGACAAFNVLWRYLSRPSLEVFLQFTVDIGDRRVLAGVHYPSDNLSSWYTAFRLLPHVFPRRDVSRTRWFLWKAINRKSIVFRAIKNHIAQVRNSPYARAVQAIRRVAT